MLPMHKDLLKCPRNNVLIKSGRQVRESFHVVDGVFLRVVLKIHALDAKIRRGDKHGKESNGNPRRSMGSNYCICKIERLTHQGLVCRA